jgi:hypothetical protein
LPLSFVQRLLPFWVGEREGKQKGKQKPAPELLVPELVRTLE